MDSGNILFGRYQNLIVFKFVGEIRYNMGGSQWIINAFSSLIEELFEKKQFENVFIDLQEATSIDSTNLGLLASISRFVKKHFNKKPTILSTNPDINELLESVGFEQVFTILRDPKRLNMELAVLPDNNKSEKSLSEIMLDAHLNLVALNEKNQEVFKNVVQVMQAQVDQRF